MDDGRAEGKCTVGIATCGFSDNGLLRLSKYLKEIYDINVTITKDKRLYFKAESGRKFYNLVKDYIIPEMMYKFKFIKIPSADLKQGELLETPTAVMVNEDNQQPNLRSNSLEGSETNSRIQVVYNLDSNTDTSALH